MVNGKPQQLTLDELRKHAQKGIAADEKFQEAAQIRTAAERDQKIVNAIRQMRKGGYDPETFRLAAEGLGMSADEIEETVAELSGTTQPAARPAANPSPPSRVGYAQLDKEMQAWAADIERERQDRDLRNAIESDQVLGYHTGKRPESLKALLDLGKKALKGRILEAGGKVGDKARLVEEVVAELRSTLTSVGTLFGSTPNSGLGPATSHPDSDLYPAKLPDRVSVTDPGYEENLSTRLAWLIRKQQTEAR